MVQHELFPDEAPTDASDDLPPGWVWATLQDVCDINPRMTWDESFTEDLPVTFVPMAAVDDESGTIAYPEIRAIAEVWKGYTRFTENDVLFAKITPCMENGKAAIARGLQNALGFGSTEFHVLRPTEAIIPEWVYYYVRQQIFRDFAAEAMTGTAGQLRVPAKYLVEVAIPLPPLPEQRRIVEAIEAYFTRLDAGIDALHRLQANLKRYKAAVLKAACEGRLVPQDPDDEPASDLLARILHQRRARWEAEQRARGKDPRKLTYPEPTAPNTDDLPELPEGWVWATVEQVGDVQLGRQRSPKNRSNNYPTLYIRAANITEGGLDLSDVLDMEFTPREKETYRLVRGDIVLSEASGSPDQVGKPAIWNDEIEDCCFQNTVIRLRPFKFDSHYLLTIFRHFYTNGIFAQIAAGVGINHLSAGKFSRIPIPIAPVGEQIRIVDDVETRLSITNILEQQIEDNLRRAERLRQSILKQAFSGQLVPQDPADEPASHLLRRIRQGRARKK